MSDFDDDVLLAALGLQPDLVRTVASATTDHARALEKEGDGGEEVTLRRASVWTLAGSLWSVADPDPARAADCFGSAARNHARIGEPIGVLLAICAKPWAPRQTASPGPIESDIEPHAKLETLLGRAWPAASGVEDDDALGQWLERFTATETALPVGRLGLPLGLFIGVVRAIGEHRLLGDGGQAALRDATKQLLRRAGEVTRAAMADEYHWRNLHSSVLPVEPEILATCVLARMALVGDTPVEQRGEEDVARIPLVVADRLVRTAPGAPD